MNGREIQRKLVEYGMSQESVAKRIGISGPILSLILTGKVLPAPSTLEALEKELKRLSQLDSIANNVVQSLKSRRKIK